MMKINLQEQECTGTYKFNSQVYYTRGIEAEFGDMVFKMIMDDVYAPDAFETYFHIYLNKFINEIRESPETKKAFFDELKRVYYKDVKKDITEMEECMEELQVRAEEIYDRLIETQEFEN